MLRAVLSVVLGYLVIAALVTVTFIPAYFGIGADGAFRPGTYVPSAAWLTITFGLSFGAAILGGLTCAKVAQSSTPPLVLAACVFGLGLLMALPAVTNTSPMEVRGRDVGDFEAMQKTRKPAWVALLNPVVGAAGVLWGRRLERRRV